MTRQTHPQGGILVIRGGAIGDFILTLPALAALRAQFPGTRLCILGYPHIAGLALAGGLADAVHPIEARGLAACFNARAEPSPELAGFFAPFSVILSYLYDPDEVFQQSVRRCSPAVFIQGPHRPNEQEGIHATNVLLKPLERLAIFDPDPWPRLRLLSSSRVGPDAIGLTHASHTPRGAVPALAIHPGSGSEQKNWPEGKWAELLERLAASPNLNLLLVGGEAEGDRLDRLARRWPSDRLEIARSLPLVQLASRLAECRAFAGHDSGITHLAAALGLPGLVLWSETNEAVWRPRSDRMHLLRGPVGLASLGVARVEGALRAFLDCSP